MNKNSTLPINRRGFFGRAAALAAAGMGRIAPGDARARRRKRRQGKGPESQDYRAEDISLVDAQNDENFVFVKIHTNKGIVGLGEGTMTGKCKTVATAIEEHERYLVGKDPTDIEYLWQAMFRGPRYRGGPILMSALGAIDIALWDILGQALGMPIWKLLGGRARDKVKVYVKHTVQPIDPSLSDEDKFVARWVGIKKDGWSGSKGSFLPTAPDRTLEPPKAIRQGINLLRRVREAVGPDFDIHIDAHGVPTTPMAVEFCNRRGIPAVRHRGADAARRPG